MLTSPYHLVLLGPPSETRTLTRFFIPWFLAKTQEAFDPELGENQARLANQDTGVRAPALPLLGAVIAARHFQ
jgi:hypothetical protein